MTAILSPQRSQTPSKIDYSINSARYNQLEIYSYVLESRIPTLKELCDQIPETPLPQRKPVKARRNIPDRRRQYPKNWTQISRQAKEKHEEKRHKLQQIKITAIY